MFNICTNEGNPTILLPIEDTVPEGYIIEAQTSNPNYLIDSNLSNNSRHITVLAFRNRFTMAEKITLEIASLDNPTATMQQRQLSASIRVSTKDSDNAAFIDLDRLDTRNGVFALESYGLIATGRALIILDSEISPIERPTYLRTEG